MNRNHALGRRSSLRSKRAVLIWALGWAFGCGGEARPAGTTEFRDSLGIQIVENRQPLWTSGDAWSIAEAPSLQIGVVDGDVAYQFSSINTAWRRSDGAIVVADSRSFEVRIYDAAGEILSISGGAGDGPGEFRSFSLMAPYRADSMLVWDSRSRRITFLDSGGALGRTLALAPDQPGFGRVTQGSGQRSFTRSSDVVGVFADGSILVTLAEELLLDLTSYFSPELTYGRMTPEGEFLGEVAIYREDEATAAARIQGMAAGAGTTAALPPPYPRRVVRGTSGTNLYIGPGDGFEIVVHEATGPVVRRIRSHHVDLAMTEEARDIYRQAQRRSARDNPSRLAEVERSLRAVHFPATLPPYRALLVDVTGAAWLRHSELPGHEGPQKWSIFDADGILLGSLDMPRELALHQIGEDFVLATWTNEFEVPFIRMYPLSRR